MDQFPAQRIKKWLVSLTSALIFGFLFFILPSPTSAYFKQEQFYDWGASENLNPKVLGFKVSAQEETPEATGAATANEELYTPDVLPGNPLYWAKRISEQVQLLTTLDAKTKTKLKLTFADRRIAEAKELVDQGKVKSGLRVLGTYDDRIKDAAEDLSDLDEKGVDISDLAQVLEKATAIHTSVLEDLTPVIPEENSKILEDALTASQKGMDRAADAMDEPAVPIDLLARLNSLRGQGIITEEETTSMLQAKTREEARETFKKFVDKGIIPQADFKRFDSGQAKYFAEDFNKAVEMYKFKELVDLEKKYVVDEETQKRMEEFAKNFKAGDVVPPDLRKYWAQTIRLEEVQKTINVDKVDERFFEKNQQVFDKFQELRDRVRPTAGEARFAEEYVKNNPNREIPPEVARILTLRNKFGMVKAGEQPAPGHRESTFLPAEVTQFRNVPFQTGSEPGGYDYQNYLKGAKFLPAPTSTPPSDIGKCPEGSTWNGWICFFPPTQQNTDFRQPYVAPSTNTQGGSPTPYQPYVQSSPGNYVSPSSTTGPAACNVPTPGCPGGQYWDGRGCVCRTSAPMPAGVPDSSQGQQPQSAPQNPGSCPPGSSWNGSTCFFPPSDGGGSQPPPPPDSGSQPPPPPDSGSQ
jgi:hypothetical protein